MFLKTYTELPVDFDRVRAAMRQRPLRWLEGLADDTGSDSQRMLVAVGLELGGHMVDRPARLTVGEPVTTEHVASLPLRLGSRTTRHRSPASTGASTRPGSGPAAPTWR